MEQKKKIGDKTEPGKGRFGVFTGRQTNPSQQIRKFGHNRSYFGFRRGSR
jgi:hypothetical protein